MNSILNGPILRSFTCTPVAWLSCGFEHCAVLTVYGTVATWGYGGSGCLGHGSFASFTAPKLVTALRGRFVRYLECGGYHTGALSTEGELFMWGRSDVGQLGIPRERLYPDELGFVLF